MSLILRSGWAAKPFLRGYAHRICLTDEERERLAALLFSRRLIDQVFKVCRDPATAVATASRLPALRRHCETTALDLLAA
jgi:hypothetical protein